MSRVPSRKKNDKPESRASVIRLAAQQSDALTPMNFRVSANFHREFKVYAAQHGMSMVDLLQESFRVLKKMRGI